MSEGEAAHLGWVMAHPARARRRVRAARVFISPKAAGVGRGRLFLCIADTEHYGHTSRNRYHIYSNRYGKCPQQARIFELISCLA